MEVRARDWKIIDGKQRCRAIRNFAVDGTLTLENLEFLTAYNGKNFSDFNFKEKREFFMVPLTVHMLWKDTPNALRNNIVGRLNTRI